MQTCSVWSNKVVHAKMMVTSKTTRTKKTVSQTTYVPQYKYELLFFYILHITSLNGKI